MEIEWPKWNKLINESFIPLVKNQDRYIILYGGRGSSKSDFAAKKLIYRCLFEPYFRCILIRNTYATIKDSSYQTIKDIIYGWGIEHLFRFKSQPLEIHCINGNSFMARGCDDTTKIKSVKDPTAAWWEEDIPTEEDFITVTTSIRTKKAKYLQEIFTINPEVEGNYQDHWFWKRYFSEKENELSFRGRTELKVENEVVVLNYTTHHSTYKDNRWIPVEFMAQLLDLKRTNPYYWTIYCEGKWGNRMLGGLFYKCFSVGRNTRENKYNPYLPIHISFDFNVRPYMTCTVWQISGKSLYNIDEIAMFSPDNTTIKTCREFARRYHSHTTGVFVYGDPAGKHEDTRSEKGFNDYTIIMNELQKYKPVLRVASSHPPVHMRGMFINTIFESGYDDCSIYINEKSVYLRQDLLFGKEAADGSKLKEVVKVDGVSFEKYHHMSDSMDYLVCEALAVSFDKYQRGDITNYKRDYGTDNFNTRKRL